MVDMCFFIYSKASPIMKGVPDFCMFSHALQHGLLGSEYCITLQKIPYRPHQLRCIIFPITYLSHFLSIPSDSYWASSLPVFPGLPAWFTHVGYGCLLDFAVSSQLIHHVRLLSGFCSSSYDFAIPSSRLHLTAQTLGVALGFVGNYAPRGLSPQTDGMPVILEQAGTILAPANVL